MSWREWAACVGEAPELFDPPAGAAGKRYPRGWDRAAKDICATCTVIDDCLASALVEGDTFTIRGGFTAEEREGMPRPRRKPFVERKATA